MNRETIRCTIELSVCLSEEDGHACGLMIVKATISFVNGTRIWSIWFCSRCEIWFSMVKLHFVPYTQTTVYSIWSSVRITKNSKKNTNTIWWQLVRISAKIAFARKKRIMKKRDKVKMVISKWYMVACAFMMVREFVYNHDYHCSEVKSIYLILFTTLFGRFFSISLSFAPGLPPDETHNIEIYMRESADQINQTDNGVSVCSHFLFANVDYCVRRH